MQTLVVYDSQYGNTERLARAIADTAQMAGLVRLVHVDPTTPITIEGTGLLIVGSPTQGWRPTPAIRSFLATLGTEKLPDLSVACFDTRFPKPRWLTGSAARVMARTVRALGAAQAAPPESFFVSGREGPLVEGELDRAAVWANALLTKMGALQPAAR